MRRRRSRHTASATSAYPRTTPHVERERFSTLHWSMRDVIGMLMEAFCDAVHTISVKREGTYLVGPRALVRRGPE